MSGRLRDRNEIGSLVGAKSASSPVLKEQSSPSPFVVWTAGYSTVGMGAEAKVVGLGEPVTVGSVTVRSGDYLLCDYDEQAVVRVPAELIARVMRWCEKRRGQDENAMQFVKDGGTVGEAFTRYRSKIEP